MGLLIFFCAMIFIAGCSLTIILDEPTIIVFAFMISIFILGIGSMAIEDQSIPEKCSCKETVQIETCKDCGGIIE